MPSSRYWMRSFCVPVVEKYTSGPSTPTPQPLSCQPQLDKPQPLQSSRFISVADVVPIRQVAVPDDVTDFENWMKIESFAHELLCALARIQSRYGTPASALKVISK